MPSETDSISLEPYRGTNDYLPAEWRVIDWIFGKWRQTARRFGYEEYATPLLEEFKLYASKTSEEIVNDQLFHFTDRGGRHLALRPEITPSLARVVAAHGKGMRQPIRFFSIGTCLRYERPQRGRTRQFEQFNLDILGGPQLENDVEVLSTIQLMMSMMAVPSDLYEIRINHRKLVDHVLDNVVKVPKNAALLRIMDSFFKLSAQDFEAALLAQGLDTDQAALLGKFMRGDDQFLRELLVNSPDYGYLCQVIERIRYIWGDRAKAVRFVPAIMRGFDYYTGLVFEVYDVSPANRRALFGGGRYDDLVGKLSNFEISGIGYGVSEVSMHNFLEVHGLLPKKSKGIDIFAFALEDEFVPALSRLCTELRQKGKNVEQHPTAMRAAKGFRLASDLEASEALFIGETEHQTNSFALKNLHSGEQQLFRCDEVAGMIGVLRQDGG